MYRLQNELMSSVWTWNGLDDRAFGAGERGPGQAGAVSERFVAVMTSSGADTPVGPAGDAYVRIPLPAGDPIAQFKAAAPGVTDASAAASPGVIPQFDQMRPLQDLLHPELNNANGAGRTELITQTYNAGLGRYEFTGVQETDAVLIGSRWTPTTLTYSFPTSGDFYADQGYGAGAEPAELVVFNAAQQAATRYAFGLISAYTNLTFVEVTESATTHADFRLSQTGLDSVGSAYANFPSSSAQAGDVWFGMTGQPFYDTPAPGNWGQATIMHELGHALGLKHGHDNYTSYDLAGGGYLDAPPGGGARYGTVALPSEHDGQSWSLMTYRSSPGAPIDFQGDGFNQPQTYMQDEIAALQHLYGANFNTQSGNTVYTWNPTTGEQSINGVGQGAPTGNIILSTLWDGNGVDTYDLSNYSTNLSINLEPGEFSTFSSSQLANHRAYSGGNAPAAGNVANARLFQGDTRSLIENANGGTGDDTLIGNQAANTLTGNNGADTLIGNVGNDTLIGGAGNDALYGDGKASAPSGVVIGDGVVTKASGLGNVSTATALDITSEFSLAANGDILNATTVPHVTISGTGDGNKDYYKIVLTAGAVITLDVDHSVGIDSFIRLLDGNGNVLAFDDDSATTEGASGSASSLDSFLSYTVATGGTYYIEIGNYATSTTNGPIDAGDTYDVQVSVADLPSVGSGSGDDTLIGGAGGDSLNGGDGIDTISYVGSALAVYVRLFNNTAFGGDAQGDVISGFENITGSSNNDDLRGSTGANVLDGGAGNDLLIGFAGADTLIGGDGIDTVSYVGSSSAVFVRLFNNTAFGGDAQGDVISGFENITGSSNNDDLRGSTGANVLDGGAGNDLLIGFAGADTLTGGDGIDTLSYVGSATAVTVNLLTNIVSGGDAQGDVISGFENLTGSSNNDVLTGNAGANVLDGGLGGDTLIGGDGIDTISYVGSSAGVSVRLFNNTAFGGDAQGDVISGFENITGSSNNDDLRGSTGANVLDGGAGNDLLIGFAGADTLIGGDGLDTISYAGSSQAVFVRLFNNTAFGGDAQGDVISGFENITGSSNNDDLRGSTGANVLDGGAGDDLLIGFAGADTLTGGDGIDTVSYVGSSAAVFVRLFNNLAFGGDAQGDVISGFENIIGSSNNDDLRGGNDINVLDGGAGNDILMGFAGADTLIGGAGGDTLTGGDGIDTVSYVGSSAGVFVRLFNNLTFGGDAQGDVISGFENIIGSSNNDDLRGGNDINVLDGGAGNDILMGFAGADTLIGGAGGDTLTGGDGLDTISYVGSAAAVTVNLLTNTVSGGDAAGDVISEIENITGSSNNDILTGNAGANVLNGGAGGDTLTGGSGLDTISYVGSSAGVFVRLFNNLAFGGDAQGDVISGFENIIG
ncbi:MAG TPA: pre-peptidase C-terminal domain-containing protein, partial [Caulobacter sp.]|nr:pre-peptidase C-terminal domain-containing protein [Caulobacter sp.]